MRHWLQSVGNDLGFDWRNRLGKFSLGTYKELSQSKEPFLNTSQSIAEESRLREVYSLESLYQVSRGLRYLETLAYLTYLEQLLPEPAFLKQHNPLRWLDVGAKNWAYVEALYRFIEKQQPQFTLHGIELDGYRRYWNGYRRCDYAQAFIQALPQAAYEVGNVMEHTRRYEVISCFFPFVFVEPCVGWGLPKRFFQPEVFLRHLVSLLEPGGWLLLLNQGSAEADEQERLLRAIPGIDITPIGECSQPFIPFQHPRLGWCVRVLV